MVEAAKLILDRLDALFRYVLPGIATLLAIYLSRPSFFSKFDAFDFPTSVIFFGLSLFFGFLMYVLHRFSIHQALDYFCWEQNHRFSVAPYLLSVRESVRNGVPREKWNDHINIRSSQLIFLFITSEVMSIAAICPAERESMMGNCVGVSVAFLVVAFILFAIACNQYIIINYLDRTLIREEQQEVSLLVEVDPGFRTTE